MNEIDALLGLVVALGMLVGWYRGFVVGTLELALLALGLAAALGGYPDAAALLERHAPAIGVWARPLAFVSIYVLARLVLGALAHRLLGALVARAHGRRADRALGMVPGLANGLIHAAVAAVLLLAVPLSGTLATRARHSVLADALTGPAQWLESKLVPVFDEAVRHTTSKLTVRPASRESIKLAFTVASPRVREDLEARMLELVNAERGKAGLAPLKPDPELAAVARAHSRDMLARGYFSHLSPEGKEPVDRIRQAGTRFLTAGENLALAPTLAAAHRGMMDSPGHRANILKPSFGRLGIGILDGGRHGLMVTQNFRN